MAFEMPVKDCLKLGFGLMRLPREGGSGQGPIDIEETKRMVDAFMAAGGKYFDTAYIYGGSEDAAREALCSRYPRESYYLATKLNASESFAKDVQAAKAQLHTSLARTGAGYFDFYLLHGLDDENEELYESYDLWRYVLEAKKEGLVRHVGFSFHDSPALLDKILTRHPEAEFVQLQINYVDWEDPVIASRAIYEVAERHGVPVVVMEPVKGGMLADPPKAVKDILAAQCPEQSPAALAVRFAASLPGVMMVLSGMSDMAQMEDNLSAMRDFRPLSEAEQNTLVRAREALESIDRIQCTSCHYCTPGCPMGIHIPEIFSVMNIYKMYGDLKRARDDYSWRPGGPNASECVGCGQCESACPQHLPIIQYLRETAEALE